MDVIDTLLYKISTIIIYPIMVVVFAAGFFMFMWGLFKFMLNLSQGSKSVDDGKQHMLWGTIGMVIMVSGYGIVQLIDNTVHSTGTSASQSIGQ
jgi:ABC-type phosphate transport system permease subunit